MRQPAHQRCIAVDESGLVHEARAAAPHVPGTATVTDAAHFTVPVPAVVTIHEPRKPDGQWGGAMDIATGPPLVA